MPRHQQVTTCRKSGGPVSKLCTCEHCNLAVCTVCGAYEGGLTTDCPGTKIDFDRQQEIYTTPLDYTDPRGWHQGEPVERRVPRFTTTRLPPEPPRIDPRTIVAPAVDWTVVDRSASLQHELSLRAIAWTLADRACDELSAALTLAKDEITTHLREKEPDARDQDLRARLSSAEVNFQLACRIVDERDDAFRKAAQDLVAALEERPLTTPPIARSSTSTNRRSETLPEIHLVQRILRALGISHEALSPEYRAKAAEAARRWMSEVRTSTEAATTFSLRGDQ
jgi:hypothetical protein